MVTFLIGCVKWDLKKILLFCYANQKAQIVNFWHCQLVWPINFNIFCSIRRDILFLYYLQLVSANTWQNMILLDSQKVVTFWGIKPWQMSIVCFNVTLLVARDTFVFILKSQKSLIFERPFPTDLLLFKAQWIVEKCCYI